MFHYASSSSANSLYSDIFMRNNFIRYEKCTDFSPLRAKPFRADINTYLHFTSLLHIDVTRVVAISLKVGYRPTYIFFVVGSMAADDLAMQGASASATMIFTILNRINTVPVR